MKDSMKVGKPGVNYYALLGVPSTATPEEITKAFRKKILHVHLDKMGPEDDTELCYLTIEAHRILSDKALRAKYDVERSSSKDYKAQEANFIPAGYICYDVGHQQMSRQLLDNITNWTSEYEKCASELSDNYFNCFSQIMAQVMNDDDGDRKNDKSLPKQQYQQNHFYCPICDKKYVTETQHWDSVINPYMAMFFSDQQGIAALNAYFQGIIGQNMFDWEVRYLPTRLLGIWGAPEWSMIPKLHQQAVNTLKQCDFKHESSPSSESESSSNDEPGPSTKSASSSSSSADVISKLEKMLECSTSRGNNASFASAQNAFLRRSLIQNLIWVVENRDQTVEQMMSRMNELIMQDDIQEIMCLGMAMRNVLKFQSSEWEQLIQDALSQEQFELAMLWTMLAIESGDKGKSDWFQLGMTIRGMGDAVLAHFCFLLSGCEETDAWEDLADLFTQNGAHYAAIEYHLNKGNLFQLLEKSRELKKVDAESAAIYSGIFYATRVKGLLQVLRKRSRQCFSDGFAKDENYDAEMEELIDLIQELGGNTLEGFRIIVSTWPDVFEDSLGQWIHRASIQYLRKGAINLKSQKLILAAIHYLPEDEQCEEICTMTGEACQLTRSMLERAQETNDFEMLTDVLLHLNKRTLSTAEEYLNEIRPCPPPPPPVQETNEEEMTGENEENGKTEEPEPAPLPQPPEPSHKSAIYLLLSGTIHKVHENWLDAMKDYQNALLSAPEVMHRVLPCVSKLVQDIQFHEAVVAQVQQEIEELQNSLLKKEYPNVDEFSSDKRRSLILTDVTPKMDYGYKDSVAKIQPDPEKMPPPPPPDEEPMDAPPPPPANTPMVTLDRNQEAINSGQLEGQMDQLSAALAYVDLLKALPLQMHPGPIVMAASHFLRAMDDNSKPGDMGKLYAYRNAIMLMAENLLRVDKKLQHTIHHGLTHKHMLSILLSAHEKLSKALQLAKKNDNNNHYCKENESSVPTPDDDDTDNDKVNTNHEAEDNNNCTSPNKKDLIRKSEAHVISKFFQNVVNFPKVEPLASIPTLNCSDLVYVETLGNSFLSQFCADKVRQKHQSPMIPKHLHAYSLFVEVWKGRSTLSDFPQARVKAMEELLALNGWTMANVQSKMMWPFLSLSDGFSPTRECILQLREPFRSYRTIDGFHINYETGSVELIMSRDPCFPVDTLFDWHDIIDVVSLSKAGLDKLVFSLETPDGGSLNSHPFKEAKFTVAGQNKANTPQQQQKIISQIPEFIMGTLSRVSMLLCYLASGLEICSETPFWMRRTDEGLLARLDEHLQHLARPISWRKAEQRESNEKSNVETETIGKFWLNMIEVFEEIEEDEEEGHDDPLPIVQSRELTYRVGEMRTEIRPNTLVILDPKRGKQKLSPEAEFCRDLTRHFKEFSRAFPELQRLEELVKLSIVCSKLRQVLKENKALIQEFQSKSHSSSSSDSAHKESSKLKAVQRVCSVIESFLALQNPQKQKQENNFPTTSSNNCNWFPAIFCHNMDPDVYDVTAVLDLDPVVTYGPVPSSPKPIKVPLERIIEMGGGRQVSPIGIETHIKKAAVIDVCQEKITNTKDGKVDKKNEKEVEQVESDENEKEVSEGQEECANGETENDEDGVSVNDRMLSAVPEESEDEGDDEMEDEEEVEELLEEDEEVCKEEESVGVEIVGSEEEISEYEDEESEMDQEISVEEEDEEVSIDEEDEVAVADESIASENEEESQCVSEIDEDDDDKNDHEATNEKMDHVAADNLECSESEEEEQKDDRESVDVVEKEEEVPTLTIKIKRLSIVSQTDEENNNRDDINKVEMHQQDSNNETLDSEEAEEFSENEDEKEEENRNMPQQDDVSSEIVTDDNDVDDAESESLDEQDEDKNKVDDELDENKMQRGGTGAFDENGEIKNSLNSCSNGESNNDEKEDGEESEILSDNVMECMDDEESSVSENEGIENGAECEDVYIANGESTEEEESYSGDVTHENGTEEKSKGSSPRKNSDPAALCKAIEGKCETKLKKCSESLESSNALQNVTKRSFLTRRSRLMTKANSENVMGNIVSDSEKTENDREEGDLFIPEK